MIAHNKSYIINPFIYIYIPPYKSAINPRFRVQHGPCLWVELVDIAKAHVFFCVVQCGQHRWRHAVTRAELWQGLAQDHRG